MKVDKIEDRDLPESRESEEAAKADEVVDGQLSLLGDADPEDAEAAEDAEAGETGDAAEAAEGAEEASGDDAEDVEGAEPDEAAGKPEKPKKAKKAAGSGKAKSVRLTGPGKGKKPARPAKERREAPLWSVIVLAVVAAGLAAGTFVLRAGSADTLTKDEVDKAVRTAAATAQHISSWDYRTIESDTKQVLSETTGDFREAYEKSAVKLLESAPAQQAVTVGLTSKAGVESVSKGRVKVLVFLNQQTTRKDADAHIEQHRLLLTMVQKDGEWLVSKLDILG